MEIFQNILVPIDGSANSRRTLAYAGYLAGRCHASVGILNVVNLSAEMSSVGLINTGGYIPDRVLKDIQNSGQSIVDEALKQLPSTIEAQGFVEIGVPTEAIVAFGIENGYDLIIMGSRGLGAFKEFVLGSVSSYVLHHAPCPVMVIR